MSRCTKTIIFWIDCLQILGGVRRNINKTEKERKITWRSICITYKSLSVGKEIKICYKSQEVLTEIMKRLSLQAK